MNRAVEDTDLYREAGRVRTVEILSFENLLGVSGAKIFLLLQGRRVVPDG